MNMMNDKWNKPAGFTLLEVVLAIAVFALGMLALVELQTGLARSGSDANLRTVAMNIAEQMVEQRRGFADIAEYTAFDTFDEPETVQVGEAGGEFGVEYTANLIVEEYYWDADTETFVTTAPEGIVNSDYKTMDIVVMWRPLDGSEGETFEDHGTIDFGQFGGGVRIIETVSSQPPRLGALIASSREVAGSPQVDYNPGDNPDIIRITLDEDVGKFKESTSPTPNTIVNRAEDALVMETWFDVVTYSQINPNAQAAFLRREEFAVITCQCDLEMAPDAANYGLQPTLWNGVDYTEGAKVEKPIGIPVNNLQQSQYCSVCCRDHHDGAGNGVEDVYNRADAGGQNIDHEHFAIEDLSTAVGDGERYDEVCRLVRKDGFMRVTQDASQAALVGFPEGYLEFDEGVADYSAYVIDAVGDYYAGDQTNLLQPSPPDDNEHVFPARNPDPLVPGTDLPTALLADSQQLRSRAIYTDYLTSAAQTVIDDCFPIADRTDDCAAPNASTELEIYPFFDLQMTFLSSWANESLNNVVTVTSDPIPRQFDPDAPIANQYSRGAVKLVSDESTGRSTILITSANDNLGLVSYAPIRSAYVENEDRLYVDARLSTVPTPPLGTIVSGALESSVRRVPASDLTLTPSENVMCGHTAIAWSCAVGAPGTLTVGNYSLNNRDIYVCSGLTGRVVGTDTTTFTLPDSGTYDIWVTENADCSR